MGNELQRHFSTSIFISSSDLASEIWSVSAACPPATQEAHKHPSQQHTRCSSVSLQHRQMRRQQILHWQLALGETLSSHLNSIRPQWRQHLGISFHLRPLVHLRCLWFICTQERKSHLESNVTFVTVIYIAAAHFDSSFFFFLAWWNTRDHQRFNPQWTCSLRSLISTNCWPSVQIIWDLLHRPWHTTMKCTPDSKAGGRCKALSSFPFSLGEVWGAKQWQTKVTWPTTTRLLRCWPAERTPEAGEERKEERTTKKESVKMT